MRFKVDHDFHIHSNLSLCANDPEQTPERILRYAKENGLNTICLTDHFWDERIAGASPWYKIQNREHIKKALPLPKDENVKFLFGAEADMDMYGTIGVTKETFDELDFVIIPTTHLHMEGFTISPEDSASVERRALMAKNRTDYFAILDMLDTDELMRLFTKAAKLGVGIELNKANMSFSDSDAEKVLRMFRIAKNCGCKFYLGSDAHTTDYFANTKETFERAIDWLELTEDDKFHIEI